MSMSLYVLSDRQLASTDAWQQSIDTEGFAVRLPLALSLQALRGVVAVKFRERSTAFECGSSSAAELMAESPDIDFGRRWRYALAFHWGGNIDAGIAVHLAAAAYAKAVSGVILHGEENKIISPKRAAEIAIVELEQGAPIIEAAVRKAVEQFRK